MVEKIDENDLLDFLKEGQKIGEQTFRDRFGYCPRGLLNVLIDTVLTKELVDGKVAYKLIDGAFIRDAYSETKECIENDWEKEPEINDDDIEISTKLVNEISKATGITKIELKDVGIKTGSQVHEEFIDEFEIDDIQEISDSQMKFPHTSFAKLKLEHKQKIKEEPQIKIKEEELNEKNGKKSFWQRIKKRKK